MILSFLAAGAMLLSPSLDSTAREEAIERAAWIQVDPNLVIDAKHQKDLDHDVAMGKEYAKEVAKQFKPTANKEYQDRVERIGNKLAAIANTTSAKATWGDKRHSVFEYHFTVLADKDVNAFSLPGGFIYVNDGLVNFVESDDELAGVLAHEISHAAFRHVATLQREESKIQLAQIPLIIAAILAKGSTGIGILQGAGLLEQALGSGWSVKAEEAADYGGFQFMMKSSYNPVGMLTMMERLALLEKTQPEGLYDMGILRTHPPGPERAESLTKELQEAGIAIHRSAVTTSFRTTTKPAGDGTFEIDFGKRKLATLRGPDASGRATAAVTRINEFFDKVPALYEVRATGDGSVVGFGRTLLTIQQTDLDGKQTPADAADSMVKAMKDSLYMLAFRVWDSH